MLSVLRKLAVSSLFLAVITHSAAQSSVSPAIASDPAPQASPTPLGPSGIISSVAGNGKHGQAGNNGPAAKAQVFYPSAVAATAAGDLYIAEPDIQTIQKITASTGIITTYAGTLVAGYSGDNGKATTAKLHTPSALAVDVAGDLYIADQDNNVIRKVAASTGIITTVAGTGSNAGTSTCAGIHNGILATAAMLCQPSGVAIGPSGNLYILESGNNVVREVNSKTGIITTTAGNGQSTYSGDGGLAINAAFAKAASIAVDKFANLYIGDSEFCTIRKVNGSTGIITTIIGLSEYSISTGRLCGLSGQYAPASGAVIGSPLGLAFDGAGNLFFADSSNDLIDEVPAGGGELITLAGEYLIGFEEEIAYPGYSGDNGPATYARFNSPRGIAVDGNDNVYIADFNNSAVRKVTRTNVFPTPTMAITPLSGPANASTTVTITSYIGSSPIYYTTDGTLPTVKSTLYTGPFKIGNSAIVTAFGVLESNFNTPATVANYFYAPSPTFSPASEVITKPTVVAIKDANAEAAIWYTTDGSSPWSGNPSAKQYSAPITVPVGTFLNAAAEVSLNDFGNNLLIYPGSTTSAYYTATAKPVVVTKPATSITSISVTLNATVAPNGPGVAYYFAYGLSASELTQSTEAISLTGTAAIPVTAQVFLNNYTRYFFQIVATGPAGTVKGAILDLVTPK